MLNYYQTWKRSLKEGVKLCSVVWASFPIATVDNFDSVCMLDHSLTILINAAFLDLHIFCDQVDNKTTVEILM